MQSPTGGDQSMEKVPIRRHREKKTSPRFRPWGSARRVGAAQRSKKATGDEDKLQKLPDVRKEKGKN